MLLPPQSCHRLHLPSFLLTTLVICSASEGITLIKLTDNGSVCLLHIAYILPTYHNLASSVLIVPDPDVLASFAQSATSDAGRWDGPTLAQDRNLDIPTEINISNTVVTSGIFTFTTRTLANGKLAKDTGVVFLQRVGIGDTGVGHVDMDPGLADQLDPAPEPPAIVYGDELSPYLFAWVLSVRAVYLVVTETRPSFSVNNLTCFVPGVLHSAVWGFWRSARVWSSPDLPGGWIPRVDVSSDVTSCPPKWHFE